MNIQTIQINDYVPSPARIYVGTKVVTGSRRLSSILAVYGAICSIRSPSNPMDRKGYRLYTTVVLY